MKILLAPDKFKGTLTAARAARIMADAVRSIHPDAETLEFPLADGGEGTVQTLLHALHGELRQIPVHDPLGRIRNAEFAIAGTTAILEMAEASGMALLAPSELNPLKTSTFGTGELIRAALDEGAREIIIGIGGSATVDGGAGMAEALGFEFYSSDGKVLNGLNGGRLGAIGSLRSDAADPRLAECRIRIASDVRNPLLGPEGAVAVFAPQKGAGPEMLPVLEKGLANLQAVLRKAGRLKPAEEPGDGAAGGLGMGLRAFCGARMEPGAELVIALTGLEAALDGADLVITGEGCTDSQTDSGKLCSKVLSLCRKRGVRCGLLSGCILGNAGDAFDFASACTEPGRSPEELRLHAEQNLSEAARRLAKQF